MPFDMKVCICDKVTFNVTCKAFKNEKGKMESEVVFWVQCERRRSCKRRLCSERLCKQRAFWSAIEWMPRELVSVAVLNSADAWRRSRRTTQRTNLLLSCSHQWNCESRCRFLICLPPSFVPRRCFTMLFFCSLRRYDTECKLHSWMLVNLETTG